MLASSMNVSNYENTHKTCTQLLFSYYLAICVGRRCNVEYMRALMYVERLDGEENKTVPASQLMTLEGNTLGSFIKELPYVYLNKNAASDVKINEFDKLASEMEAFRKQAAEDARRIEDLQNQLVEIQKQRGGCSIL